MANESLKRTPTSTGNRKVWTWAGWVKRNKVETLQYIFNREYVSSANSELYFTTSNSIEVTDYASGYNIRLITTQKFRDTSSWYHILLSIDTTSSTASDRVKLYVNGDRITDFGTETYPSINLETQLNTTISHEFSDSAGAYDIFAELTDVFLVDGQALTPDVFGFYKDGDGYQSSGTTKATDFRPGQWSPRLPKSIKHTINRSGGFGVNGFYLPMNDSSNPGADFHCAPNSIIKLKGEDLPQPRNGAPTTSDAYVSQLRQETGELSFDGVVKFDGSGDYLEIPDSDDFDFGSGDFTVEAFIEGARGGSSTNSVIFNQSTGSASSNSSFYFGAGTNGISLYLSTSGSSWTNFIQCGNITSLANNGFHHVVWQRRSNTLEIYVDGILQPVTGGNASFTGTIFNSSRVVDVGRQSTSGSNFNGFISNLRVVKGTAVYTGNFTAPTEPLTNVTNTKLLCCNSSTSATAATVTPGTITANGNAFATRNELTGSLILACPFVSGGLGQNGAANSTIPGLGDYHISLGGPSSIPAVNFLIASGNQAQITGDNGLYYGSSLDVTTNSINPRATVGTAFTPDGDYTVEFWCYINSFNSGGSHIVQYDTNAGQTGWLVSFDSGNIRWMLRNNSNQDVQVSIPNVVIAQQWNHFAGVYNSSRNTMTAYLNGVAVGTTIVASNYLSTQYTNLNRIHIGSNVGNGSRPMQGYLQDLRIYKGLAKYKGGFDVSKPYTPVGMEAFRTTADTCKNNFATLNPLFNSASGDVALVDGNLTYTGTQNPSYAMTQATHGVSSGKWYWEFRLGDTLGPNIGLGVARLGTSAWSGLTPETAFISGVDGGIGFYHGVANNIYYWNGSSQLSVSYTIAACTSGDIVSIALDLENGKIYYAKNGTWGNSGNPATGTNPVGLTLSGLYLPALSVGAGGSSNGVINFGQNSSFSGQTTAGTNADGNGKGLFKYAPPSGFLALCEDNLPAPAIADPGKHFKTVLWTGDGNAGRGITGLGFKPDFVWIKDRGDTSSHSLFDSVRGAGIWLSSNSTSAEQTSYINVYNPSFNDDGFGVGTDGGVNGSGSPYVAWCWKAGGPPVSNNDGSITSQVSANRTAGFSIVSYTGNNTTNSTVGHGLGKTPSVVITKSRTNTQNPAWHTSHVSLAPNYDLALDSDTAAWTPTGNGWHELTSSSVFTLKNGSSNGYNVNRNGDNYIAYCWTEIEGYSKFGNYVGNNSADGTFVYCGFKPAWVLIKNTDQNGTYWTLFDSSRKSTNPANHTLNPNLSHVEETNGGNGQIDLLSNGFKCRNTDGGINGNGINFIFMAFAESPFQTANAK